jgi:hypothetical protein
LGRNYYDDVIDLAIKHAGHDILREEKGASGEARFSDGFEKRMKSIIDAEKRKQGASQAMKAAVKIAVALLIVVVISTAVIFSSEALRSRVMNLFYNIGSKSADVEFYEVDGNDIPEGMVIPGYMPQGYKLAEATKLGLIYKSIYENSGGDTISILQKSAGSNLTVNSEDAETYEVEIKNINAFVSEIEGINYIFFSYDSYDYTLFGKIEVSELKGIAESIIE